MAVKNNTSGVSMNRQPSNYTANNGVRQKVHDNPIPSDMIGDCIKHGKIASHAPNNQMQVTLRYERGTEFIELRMDLEDSKVFGLSSSYERDWQDDLN